MMQDNMKDILNAIALKNGTTPDQIYREMQKAIDNTYASGDPAIKIQWEKIPHDPDAAPMVEDLLLYLTKKLSPETRE